MALTTFNDMVLIAFHAREGGGKGGGEKEGIGNFQRKSSTRSFRVWLYQHAAKASASFGSEGKEGEKRRSRRRPLLFETNFGLDIRINAQGLTGMGGKGKRREKKRGENEGPATSPFEKRNNAE